MIYIDCLDLNELKSYLNSNNLILFGAGQGLYDTINILQRIDDKLIGKIDFIVDNNKANRNVFVFEKLYRITSAHYLREKWHKGQVIIISAQFYEEISEQIGAYSELSEAVVIFYEHIVTAFLLDERWMPDSFKVSEVPLIPKVIHYCWFGKNPIPERYKEWMATWKKYCPDYEIVEWNETNYDYKKNEFMYEAYKAGKWGFVPDYARLDIIYNYGGIYLDTDVELVRNLDELLYQKAFAGLQGDLRVANGLGFGAVPYHANIKKQMQAYDGKHFVLEDGSYDLTPAPVLQTEIMKACGYRMVNKYQIVDDVSILPAPVLGGIIASSVIVDDRVFAIHHYDGSWVPQERREKQKKWRSRLSRNLNEYYRKRNL